MFDATGATSASIINDAAFGVSASIRRSAKLFQPTKNTKIEHYE